MELVLLAYKEGKWYKFTVYVQTSVNLLVLTLGCPHLQDMSEYSVLLSDLSENITNEDLDQLKSACKEDIPEEQSNAITSSKEWFHYLEKNDKLSQGERHRVQRHTSTSVARNHKVSHNQEAEEIGQYVPWMGY